MQTMSADWPSMTRVRSSRHSKKVSCETLSNVDLCSTLQCEEQNVYYYSDDEKDNRKEGSAIGGEGDCDLDNPSYGYGKLDNLSDGYLPQDRELENPRHGHGKLDNPDYVVNLNKLENPGYGEGKAFPAAGRRFLACLLPNMLHSKSDVGDASRLQAGERWKKRPQSYPSAVYRTGGLLPHSGRIILHRGSHSGPINNINNKATTFLKASSIIPPAVGRMNLQGAGEPFSPKVTCLGGVRIKQKCCEHIGKSTSVVANDNIEKQIDVRCTTSVLKRREKKATATFAQQKKAGRVGLCNSTVEADCCDERSEENVYGLKASTIGDAMEKPDSTGQATMASRYVMEEESKRWSLRETTRHDVKRKASYQDEQKWQSREASACGASFSEAEFSINLSRFGSEQGHGMIMANSVTNLVSDKSQRFELEGDDEFTAQAPPRNALLLMRNSRPMEVTSSCQQEADEEFVAQAPPRNALFLTRNSRPKEMLTSFQQEGDEKIITQAPPRNALLLMRNSRAKDNSSSAQWSGQETSRASSEKTMSTQVRHKFEKSLPACLEMEMEMKEPMVATNTPCLVNKVKNLRVHRQASFPQPSLQLSLWQRRAIAQPCALDILKPIKSESKQATTT